MRYEPIHKLAMLPRPCRTCEYRTSANIHYPNGHVKSSSDEESNRLSERLCMSDGFGCIYPAKLKASDDARF